MIFHAITEMPPKTPAERSKAYRDKNRNNAVFKAKNRDRKRSTYVPRHLLAEQDPERLEQIRESGKLATSLYRLRLEEEKAAKERAALDRAALDQAAADHVVADHVVADPTQVGK